jgi:hypothetical protein
LKPPQPPAPTTVKKREEKATLKEAKAEAAGQLVNQNFYYAPQIIFVGSNK